MLITYGFNKQTILLPVGAEVSAGQPVTIKDGKIYPLKPGERFVGFAGLSAFIAGDKNEVYFRGELGTAFFAKDTEYEPLDDLYINASCVLTNVRDRYCSERVGRAVNVTDIFSSSDNSKILRFWLEELSVLPKLSN